MRHCENTEGLFVVLKHIKVSSKVNTFYVNFGDCNGIMKHPVVFRSPFIFFSYFLDQKNQFDVADTGHSYKHDCAKKHVRSILGPK